MRVGAESRRCGPEVGGRAASFGRVALAPVFLGGGQRALAALGIATDEPLVVAQFGGIEEVLRRAQVAGGDLAGEQDAVGGHPVDATPALDAGGFPVGVLDGAVAALAVGPFSESASHHSTWDGRRWGRRRQLIN